jgi:hypothetical protein
MTLPFDSTDESDAALTGAVGRKCSHPRDRRARLPEGGWLCNCGHVASAAKVRQGRHNLRAGKDAERHIAKQPGGRRTGHFGGPDDDVIEPPTMPGVRFVVQSKAGGWFSNRYWAELAKLPRTGGGIPTLIVSDRPGSGTKTRVMVVRVYEDDCDLHGKA